MVKTMNQTTLIKNFSGLLVLLFATISCNAQMNIAPSAEDTNPMQAGETAPDFTVYRVDGTPFEFKARALDNPTMIITFRGGWCPYCNAHLQELRTVLPVISQSGVDVLFLSGDRPEILYSNLKQETQESIANLDYTIYSDAKLEASMKFGLAFRMPENTLSNFRNRNRDMDDSSIAIHNALMIPAVYIINTDGIITYAHTNPDYKVRLPAEEVKAAAEKVIKK